MSKDAQVCLNNYKELIMPIGQKLNNVSTWNNLSR